VAEMGTLTTCNSPVLSTAACQISAAAAVSIKSSSARCGEMQATLPVSATAVGVELLDAHRAVCIYALSFNTNCESRRVDVECASVSTTPNETRYSGVHHQSSLRVRTAKSDTSARGYSSDRPRTVARGPAVGEPTPPAMEPVETWASIGTTCPVHDGTDRRRVRLTGKLW